MVEDKGKGRANDIQDATSKNDRAPAEVPDQASIFSKITSSAAGLASSAFSAPNSNEINDGRTALPGDSKSLPLGMSGTTSAAESSSGANQSVRLSGITPTAFKGEHLEQHVRQMESEFSSFLDGTEQFMPTPDAVSQLNGNYIQNDGNDSFAPTQNAFLRSTIQTQQSSSEPALHLGNDLSFHEQELLDGADVIGLLTRPSSMDEIMEFDDADIEDSDLQLTPDQIARIRSITNRFFPPARPQIAPPIEHPLNLHPELDVSSTDNNHSHMDRYDEDARRIITAQWDDVLTGYTDEVWGGLLPLVKEARQEVEAIKAGDNPDVPPKALRRLGLIFKHLQK